MEEDTDAKAAPDQMDFSGWNSDLESSFLDRSGNDNNWDETMNEWTELTTFPGAGSTSDTEQKGQSMDVKERTNVAAGNESLSLPSSSTKSGVASVTESSDRSSEPKTSVETAPAPAEALSSRLHPQAIQSSAMCPPHGKILPPNYEDVYPTPSPQVNAAANLYAVSLGRVAAAASNAAAAAGTPASIPAVLQASLASAQYHNQTLSSLAANFHLAHSAPNASRPTPGIPAGASKQNSSPSRLQQPQSSLHYVAPSSGSSSASSSRKKVPPFLLFDSPVELRANFNQNQRRLNLPVKHDCNSYHYGEAVKGFHPQHLGKEIPQKKSTVQLIDGRNAPPASAGRIKNEREQKRAQKITELIDQLGGIMKEGGWNIGSATKSKYHTLSACKEYMKHLIKTKEEKELRVNKLKKDVEDKKRRMEEDKTAQEGRSDPESVTSSLTSSTTGSSRLNPKMSPDAKKQKGFHRTEAQAAHKKDQRVSRFMSSVSTNEDSSGGSRTNGGGPKDQTFSIDKTAVSGVSDLTDSNRGSSSNNSGSGGSGSGGTRTGSGGSGSGGSGSNERFVPIPRRGLPRPQVCHEAAADEPSTSSISSDAAVASEQSSRDRHNESPQHHHKDVVIKKRKRKDRMKPPASGGSFKLDYEEVFDQSNIPQLIAGTSGKIVSWNQSFVNASGLEEPDLERMTIFSLVQPDKLSSFFEIAARALRSNDEEETELVNESSSKENQSGSSNDSPTKDSEIRQRKWNYAAMTLPCIEFPAMKERRESSSKWENIEKLNVTMILITDPDPRKRCFHCTFTDSPGTNGTLGIVTPDLLAALYSNPEKLNLEQHTHYRRKHKRAKIQAAAEAAKQKQGNAHPVSKNPSAVS